MNFFTYQNRRHEYTLSQPFEEDGEKLVHFTCPKLGLEQDFLAEDIPALILDLPNLVEANEKHNEELRQEKIVRFRVSEQDRQKIEL